MYTSVLKLLNNTKLLYSSIRVSPQPGIIRQNVWLVRALLLSRLSDLRTIPSQVNLLWSRAFIISFGLEYDGYDPVQSARFVCIFGLHTSSSIQRVRFTATSRVLKLRFTLCHAPRKRAESKGKS